MECATRPKSSLARVRRISCGGLALLFFATLSAKQLVSNFVHGGKMQQAWRRNARGFGLAQRCGERNCNDGVMQPDVQREGGEMAPDREDVARPRRNFLSAVALAGVLGSPLTSLSPAPPAFAEEVLNAEEQQSVGLYEKNTPGVVFITNERVQLQYNSYDQIEAEKVAAGSGSGWVFDDEGHIVTNFHVIQNANSLTVRFIDGTERKASVVGADPDTDVAVLQVDLPKKRKALLKPLERGVSGSLKVGQEVFAIGNPFGLDHTLTKGIVSGVGRTITSVGGRPIQGAIQTDASINPGNSGGPLLNSQGKVVGMNTVIFSPSGASAGVGFAIPSDTLTARVQSILKFGYVKRPSLGLYLGQDGLAKRFAGVDGVLVSGLQRGAAAGDAGVQLGDVIVSVAGRSVKRTNDVYAELDLHEPGETINIKLRRPEDLESLREGLGTTFETISLDVRLKEAPANTA